MEHDRIKSDIIRYYSLPISRNSKYKGDMYRVMVIVIGNGVDTPSSKPG